MTKYMNFLYQMMNHIQNYRKILYFCIIIILINGIASADRNVIIGFKKPVGDLEDEFVEDHGGKIKEDFRLIPAIAASLPETNITKMKKDPRIAYIEEEKLYKITDEYTNSWGVQHINSKPVHDQLITGAGIKVAILDTGIDYYHEDLANNYKGGYNFVANNTDPWDDNCLTQFKNCHGTHVAGIIGAKNNGIGVVGVAPNASLYAVKVLSVYGDGQTSHIISGLQWAVDNHMNIASMSFGGSDDSQALHDAVDNAYNSGVLLIASAGNTGGFVTYPAAYDSVIAVSATDSSDLNASFSATGTKVELAAPGVNIYSTINGSYGFKSGTSMSAPHVTGVAALIYSTAFQDVNGDGVNNNSDVRMLLDTNAKDLGPVGRDDIFGYGLVDAYTAVFGIPAPTPPPPVSTISLTLKRLNATPAKDAQNVNLLRGNYSINIHNINLTEVVMKIYENGKKSLIKDFEFSKKRNDVNFNLTVNNATIVFIPYGKIGSIGYVAINKN